MSAPPSAGSSLAVRAVDRIATALAGRGLGRRRFLTRLAIVGSALTLNPLRYLVRPTSAYASVCGDAAYCGGGWSVFCCTINDGANTCPDYSYVAGWWKVDASAFCLGSPRYYVDCNRKPSDTCNCFCNDTGCDRRRSCCNNFRYGQCNTQVAGVTEVVCRIVVCTPPWEWDPACSTTVRTEEATRTHSAACLPGTDPTHIEIVYQDLGLVGSALGAPVSAERDAAGGGRIRRYDHGYLAYRSSTGVLSLLGAVATVYAAHEADRGPLGFPLGPEEDGPGGGIVQRFEGGPVTGPSPTEVYAVVGPIGDAYEDAGGPAGSWGYPTATMRDVKGGQAMPFEDTAAYADPAGRAHTVSGPFRIAHDQEGGVDGSLGLPTSDVVATITGRERQTFQGGAIVRDPLTGGTQVLTGRTGRSVGQLPDGADAAPRQGRDPADLP